MKRTFELSGFEMSDSVTDPEEKNAPKGKKSLALAMLLAVVGAAGGFYAVNAGLISGGGPLGPHDAEPDASQSATVAHDGTDTPENTPVPLGDIAFVEVDPITISLIGNQSAKHLRFRAQLEVNADYERDVMVILPRVTDVMNSYLRALELKDLTDPLALTRLRAQMLRRIQVVTGNGRVRDLLIMEFVLN